MALNGIKWQQVASSGIKEHQVVSSGIKWHQVASSSIKCHPGEISCIKWNQVASYCIKWHQVTSSGIKWHQVASGKLQVACTWFNLMPLDAACYLLLASRFLQLAFKLEPQLLTACNLQLATYLLLLATCNLLLENNTFHQFSTATAQFQTELMSIVLSLAESWTELGTAPAPACLCCC